LSAEAVYRQVVRHAPALVTDETQIRSVINRM
jgi:hypothetical protein